MSKRDYSLFGPDAKRAVESGLTAAEWYHTEVPRKVMKDLMARSDQPAIRDTIILYGGMILLAGIGIALWPSWWSAPFWLAYGVLYGSASDSRWHECSHGTAFKTPWMNNWVYQIASFMIMRNSTTWRWSHARHHSETYFVGRDPEIAVMRPPELAKVILNFFGVIDVIRFFPNLVHNALFGPNAEERSFVPQAEWGKVQRVALIHLAIYAATVADVNAFSGKLSLLVEPRITDDRFYVFADPAVLPVLEYSYLSSAQGPQMASREGFDVLGMEFRVVLDFGCGAVDWRGAYLNPGA